MRLPHAHSESCAEHAAPKSGRSRARAPVRLATPKRRKGRCAFRALAPRAPRHPPRPRAGHSGPGLTGGRSRCLGGALCRWAAQSSPGERGALLPRRRARALAHLLRSLAASLRAAEARSRRAGGGRRAGRGTAAAAPRARIIARGGARDETARLPRRAGQAAEPRLQKMQNPTGTACAAAPRFLKTLARAGSLRAASGRFLKTLGQKISS